MMKYLKRLWSEDRSVSNSVINLICLGLSVFFSAKYVIKHDVFSMILNFPFTVFWIWLVLRQWPKAEKGDEPKDGDTDNENRGKSLRDSWKKDMHDD